jgi:hypothetical protein
MGLEKLFHDLPHEAMVLDFFAGTGESMSKHLDWFDDATYWEIDRENVKRFLELRPEANLIAGDSFDLAQHDEWEYKLILIENYIGIFGDHCEHFDALGWIPRLLSAEGGYVVSLVCTNPKLYCLDELIRNRRKIDNLGEWFGSRKMFYGKVDMSREELIIYYDELFYQMGLKLMESKYMRKQFGLDAVRWKLKWI